MPPIRTDVRVRIKIDKPVRREAVARDGGLGVPGVVCPHPARQDVRTQFEGLCKRLLTDRFATLAAEGYPPPVLARMERMREHATALAEHFFGGSNLSDADMSVRHWLSETNYTEAERAKFQKHADELGPYSLLLASRPNALEPDNIFHNGKCFIKSEFYDAGPYKHARWISPVDERARAIVGPFVHEVEKQMFGLPCFVKYVKGGERVAYTLAQLYRFGAIDDGSDWTSMEVHHDEWSDLCLWLPVLHYCLRTADGYDAFMHFVFHDLIRSGEGAKTKLESRAIVASAIQTLFSGKNWTSAINGWKNFATLWTLLYEKYGIDVRKYAVLPWKLSAVHSDNLPFMFEGDDAKYSHDAHVQLTAADYASVAANVKVATNRDSRLLDFISVYVDPDVPCAVSDVLSPLARFGWVLDQYLDASNVRIEELMLAKAYSTLYSCRGTPLLEALARYVIRCLSHRCLERFFRRRNVIRWEFDQYRAAYDMRKEMKSWKYEITDTARHLVERLCGISYSDQVAAEEVLHRRDRIMPLDMIPKHWFPDTWITNHLDYVVHANKASEIDLPPLRFIDNFGSEWWAAHGEQVTGTREKGVSAADLC